LTGKELCNLLRQIRRKIAETNEIEYLSADCHNEEECLGTCPKCDAEIRCLEAELQRKVERGTAISIAGISAEYFRDYVDKKPFKNDLRVLIDDTGLRDTGLRTGSIRPNRSRSTRYNEEHT